MVPFGPLAVVVPPPFIIQHEQPVLGVFGSLIREARGALPPLSKAVGGESDRQDHQIQTLLVVVASAVSLLNSRREPGTPTTPSIYTVYTGGIVLIK